MTDNVKQAAYMRDWAARNRVKINTRMKAWQQTRSEESKAKDAARKKAWAEANREKVRTANEAYQKRVGRYWIHIKQKFGVTREAWMELFAAQNEQCAVCGVSETDTKRFWAIDHCHERGITRGILCGQCNIMLGSAKDNPEILIAGAEYLKAHY